MKILTDHVDGIQDRWERAWPGLDTRPAGVVARVGRAAAFLDAGLARTFARFDLTREGFDVLAALRRSPPSHRLTPTELYQALMRTSGAMTNRLRRLEAAGLVRRVADPDDGRSILAELTPQGRALVDEVALVHLANERDLLGALTQAEQDTLAALLRKLLLSFETTPAAAPTPVRSRAPSPNPG